MTNYFFFIKNFFNFENFIKYRYPISFFWVFLFLNPVIFSGLAGDDSYNSMVQGGEIYYSRAWYDSFFSEIEGWLRGAGRINVFYGLILRSFFYITHDILITKIVVLTVVATTVIVFGHIVENLCGSKNISFLSMFLIPLLCQFRNWHDPILGFFIIIPLTTLLCFSSYYYYLKFSSEKKIKNYVFSIILFILSVLSYEIAFAFSAVYFFNILFSKNKKIEFFYILLALSAIIFSRGFNLYTGEMHTYKNSIPVFDINV